MIMNRNKLGLMLMVMFLALLTSCSKKLHSLSTYPINIHKKNSSLHMKVVDTYEKRDGYYIFYKENDSIPQKIVFFIHGFGAINPAIYGKWIKHLVSLNCAVIYPRYQKTIYNPFPGKFPETMSKGLLDAMNHITSKERVIVDSTNVFYFGHSYGGAASLYFGLEYKKYGLPKPKGIFACQPGTGPFNAMKKDNYSAMEKDIDIVVLSSEKDFLVGHKMAQLAHHTSEVKNNVWIKQFALKSDSLKLKANHSSPCSLDYELDNNIHNLVFRKAIKRSVFDQEDKEGYFKISEELLKNHEEREWLFKNIKTKSNVNSQSVSLDIVPFVFHYKNN